ncbi:MAG TPA: trypsin-like peptidase domain-containing protein [Vicinamibacterales bacterium]|jgi:serine protease Do|nr:trypsin-like peptidase domain-containing protein [Vicinamibacterales bacterium]
MVNRNKSTFFYLLLAVVASVMVGMVLASRLDLASQSSAQTAAPAVNSAPITGPVTATTFREVANMVSPAVVNIRTESLQQTRDLSEFFGDDPNGLLDRFFGGGGRGGGGGGGRGQGDDDAPRRQEPREQLVRAAGTGFIIDRSGLILTNHHVVDGATKIRVSLYGEDDDQEYDAKVIGSDQLTDSALIQLTQKPSHELPTVKWGDSAQMQPGDWVMAIGNPFGLDHTVSVGVISGNRPNQLELADSRRAEVLQTDAAINPGNSGGPLINLRGEVIGVNTAIATTGLSQGNMGVGFAIPSNAIRDILPQLRSAGKVTRGRVGVQVRDVQRKTLESFGLKEKSGALVTIVTEGGPADKGGLDLGDVVLAWNNQPVKSSNDLVQLVMKTKPGTTVPVRVLRDKQQRTLNITVEELNLDEESGRTPRRATPETSRVEPEKPKGFGITIENVTAEAVRQLRLPNNTRGAIIREVEPGSAAYNDQLQRGDVITRVGAAPVATAADAERELKNIPAGGTAHLRVIRTFRNGPQEMFLTVTKE